MGTHDIPEDERYHDSSDDWQGEWAQRRIADLKGSLADDEGNDLSDSAEIHYYDRALEDAHDDAGVYDASGEDSRAMVAVSLTRWENVWAWVWWQRRWIIPLIALLVPLLLLAGGFIVLTLLSGDESDSAPAVSGTMTIDVPTPVQTADWPPSLTFIEHTIPTLIRHELPFAGAMHGYVFVGAAGAVWRIEVEPDYDSALDPMVRVYGPDGREFATNDNRATGALSAEVRVTLPGDGAYRVVIQSGGEGLTTGVYWLTVSEAS